MVSWNKKYNQHQFSVHSIRNFGFEFNKISRYFFIFTEKNADNTYHEYGLHGYDNNLESMRPIFMAKGPSFKIGKEIDEEFINIDLFHLFCRLLGLRSVETEIDGDDRIKVWEAMLRDYIVHKYQYIFGDIKSKL